MSFGFGISDFVLVVSLAHDVYQRCKASTTQFRDIAKEVGNTHIVMERIHAFWDSENKRGEPLLIPQQEELKEYTANCEEELQKLKIILQKNERLATDGKLVARAKFAWTEFVKDIASIRGRLQAATGALAVFHSIITGDALARYSHGQTAMLRDQANLLQDQTELLQKFKEEAQILSFFIRSYQDFQDGTRAEPAYSQAARGADEPAEKSYTAAGDELRAEGISTSAVKAHHLLIKEWIDTVILAPTTDENDDEDEDDGKNDASVDSQTLVGSHNLPLRQQNSNGRRSEQIASEGLEAAKVEHTLFPETPTAPIIPRSHSVSTHRSQSSTWEVSDVQSEVGDQDYASIMIAKVLRSKYPPESGDELIRLPIKRAFRSLDWTSRGWLTRAQVEASCIDAARLTGWTFDVAQVAKVVMLEDNKGNNPDHHIDPDEFFNIVIAIREEVKKSTTEESTKAGLNQASVALWQWFLANKDQPPLSDQWHITYPYRETAAARTSPAFLYQHDIAGHLPESNVPLEANLTNSIYLATQFSTSKLDAAMRHWQAELRALPSEKRLEYTEALNNVIEVTSFFHQFQEAAGVDSYHEVDRTLEYAPFIPVSSDETVEGYPLQEADNLRLEAWTIVGLILGFVRDLGFVEVRDVGPQGIKLPQLKRWRKMRMLDRSREIRTCLNDLEKACQLLRNVQDWQQKNLKALKPSFEACLRETRLLRQAQEQAAQGALLTSLDIEVTLPGVPHLPFRKPKTYLMIDIDGLELHTGESYGETGIWSRTFEFKKSSTIRLDFHDFTRRDGKLLGSVAFNAKDVVDFARSSTVSFKRRLEGGSSSSLTAEVSVKPVKTRRSGLMTRGLQDVVDEAAVAEEGKKLELPLQTYILTHPIPSAWEIRRNDRTDGMRSDLVYFHNKETGKNTAMLWDDRLGLEVPNAPLQALPSNWTREVKEGNIIYRDNSGRVADLPQITDGSETYENVLQPVLFTRPWLFHV